MQTTPLVSILLPAYNAMPYITEAIESILAQTYANVEFIIIDDCSTDGTSDVIAQYTQKGVKHIRNSENKGLIYGLNYGISLCTGVYIARMDADDIAHPTRIAKQVAFMEANPQVGICGTWFRAFGAVNQLNKYEATNDQIKLQMLYHCRFCHPTVMLRSSVLKEHNFAFDTNYPHAEDYELWARMGFATQFANIQEELLQYRTHNKSVTAVHSGTQKSKSVQVIQNLFAAIGAPTPTDEVVDYWQRFCYADFTLTPTQLKQVEQLMVATLQGNQQSHYVSQQAMQAFFAAKWFNYCYNTVKKYKPIKELFYKSLITRNVGVLNTLKFALKSLM